MVCASIPALKPFIVRYFGKYFSKWSSGRLYYGNSRGQGDSANIQLSGSRLTGNQDRAKKNSLFYKGSVVTTTEITASHSDENRLVDPHDLHFQDVELGSQASITDDERRQQMRVFNSNDLRIMKFSNVHVDSRRVSQDNGLR